MQMRSYNDKQLDTLSRAVFYDALKSANQTLDENNPDVEKLHALAAALEASSCGVEWDAEERDEDDLPATMRSGVTYNDDLLNQKAREVYVRSMQHMQAYIQGSVPMNTEKLQAYSRIAESAACGFHPDEDDDD